MITFDNFKFREGSKVIDVTIPPSSIVYLNNCDSNIFTEKSFSGEILFQGFPIQHAMKSFTKNIFFYATPEVLLEKLTLSKNMKAFALKFDCDLIWNVPLSYFSIDENLWSEKMKNLDFQTKLCACYGLILLFQGNVCLVNVAEVIEEKVQDALKNIMISRANYGRDIIFYHGKNLNIEKEIIFNL